MRLGAVNCVDWPLSEEDLLRVVKDGLAQGPEAVDRLEAHAAARWASAVVQVLGSSRDLTTCAEWGRHVGISERTLQNLCRRAGLSPRRSLLLARLLRAVWNRQRHGWRLEHSLATADDRTLRRLFHLGGSRTGASQNVAGDVRELVDEQALIQDPVALREIRRLLNTRISVKS
jgi:AraC-like DNA-binding protein